MPVEVVHGDGVVPVAQVILRVGRLLLPPHAAHCQQDGCGESSSQRTELRETSAKVPAGCRGGGTVPSHLAHSFI